MKFPKELVLAALRRDVSEPSSLTVTLSWADSAGGRHEGTTRVRFNEAPRVEVGANGEVREGIRFERQGVFVDPDSGAWGGTVDYGDGTGVQLLVLNSDKTFLLDHTYADNGTYTITVTVTDDAEASGNGTLAVTVVNSPPSAEAQVESQAVQYSDPITPVVVTVADVAADTLEAALNWSAGGASTPGLPNGLMLLDDGCTVTGNSKTCMWRIAGHAGVPEGVYTIEVRVSDEDGGESAVTTFINVVPEYARLAFSFANPGSVQVPSPGGASGFFRMFVEVAEAVPDESQVQPAAPGDVGLASVSMVLMSVGPGGAVTGACTPLGVVGSGYDAILTVGCDFDRVPVNTYSAQATVGGSYYRGSGEDVLVVFDPSLGFTTGGGWFYWPGSADTSTGYPGDRTNVGFNAKYLSRSNVKGSLLLIRHLRDGSIYRLKSNAMTGLSVGSSGSTLAWATITGKATYVEPGWPEPIGNYPFTAYVEDRGEPGTSDRIWIEVKDRDGVVESDLSMRQRATDNAVTIQGGNIVVPHGSK